LEVGETLIGAQESALTIHDPLRARHKEYTKKVRTIEVFGGKNSREKNVACSGSAAILSVIFSILKTMESGLTL
jgi:hypothetical protein